MFRLNMREDGGRHIWLKGVNGPERKGYEGSSEPYEVGSLPNINTK